MKKMIVLWFVLVGSAQAGSGDVWLDMNIGSKHFGGSSGYCYQGRCGSLNESNRGLGVSYEASDNLEAKAGFYENSYFNATYYIAAAYSANFRRNGFTVSPGVTVGLATGYDETRVMAMPVQPTAIASLKMQSKETRVVISYMPMRQVIGQGNDVVALQVGKVF